MLSLGMSILRVLEEGGSLRGTVVAVNFPKSR